MQEISIATIIEDFENHLELENNFRVIFSGKFGIGKTFFLNKFFDSKQDSYNKILISPVNYVVSQNEDIFELIKADIIKELFLSGKIELSKVPEDTNLQKISRYLEENPLSLPRFLANLLTKIDPVTETPKKILDLIAEFIEKYKKVKKDKAKKEQTRSQEAAEYLDESERKSGSIYEYNYITKVINTFLEEIRGRKKNILIIDDLDRIDPEHIFRILNVLSVHGQMPGEKNKFSFDQIIVVCDIENIRKIFYHKYGNGVDFEGYIDKFYSTEIFRFNNNDALINYVDSVFNGDKGHDEITFISFMLSEFVNHNIISVRKLLKHEMKIEINNVVLYMQEGFQERVHLLEYPRFLGRNKKFYFESNNLPILRFFKLMGIIFGDFELFMKALEEIRKSNYELDYTQCRELVSFLALQYHITSEEGDSIFFKKNYSTEGGQKYVNGIGAPQTSFLGRKFQIKIKWNSSFPYKADQSYFDDAVAVDLESVNYFDNKSGIKISSTSIIEAIEAIANLCFQKGYLKIAKVNSVG